MSALAQLLTERGCSVSGCDAHESTALDRLSALGVRTSIGHGDEHVRDVDVVTASPAVPAHASELAAARERGVRVVSRAEVLAALALVAPMVGFAGTHGKTTTTSMAAHVWTAARRDPSWLLGAPVGGLGEAGHYVDGSDLLVEVDESYGTFALVAPTALAVLNVDPDHLDFYGDAATLERAFADLVDRTSDDVVIWTDHPGANRVASLLTRDIVRVGRDADASFRVTRQSLSRVSSRFVLVTPTVEIEIELAVPGAHNVANAAVAASMALVRGIDAAAVQSGLGDFVGAPRRFEYRGDIRGTTIVDDYAHLPAEVAETIATARSAGFQRLAVVFQPHRVTRTLALAPDFAGVFDGVERVIVTDIYTAGESNPDGVTGEIVARAVRGGSTPPAVTYEATLEGAAASAAALLGDVDALLILGAGDVGRVIDLLGVTA